MTAAPATDPSALIESLSTAYYTPGARYRHGGHWVMDRSWYDRVRHALVSDEQEKARAQAHAGLWIPVELDYPAECPACPSGPFASLAELGKHAALLADPGYREPSSSDQLLGLRIIVREDGGEPHLEMAT